LITGPMSVDDQTVGDHADLPGMAEQPEHRGVHGHVQVRGVQHA
jgi:hypothetical protein